MNAISVEDMAKVLHRCHLELTFVQIRSNPKITQALHRAVEVYGVVLTSLGEDELVILLACVSWNALQGTGHLLLEMLWC